MQWLQRSNREMQASILSQFPNHRVKFVERKSGINRPTGVYAFMPINAGEIIMFGRGRFYANAAEVAKPVRTITIGPGYFSNATTGWQFINGIRRPLASHNPQTVRVAVRLLIP